MLIAADTNVLLDLALEVGAVVDALATMRQRLPEARFVVPPTVLLQDFHVAAPIIATPREIVRKFFR